MRVIFDRARQMRFFRADDGATAVEYALIALIVGLGIINALQLIPPALDAVWTLVVGSL